MKPACLLFRKNKDNKREFEIASKYFEINRLRTECFGNLVVGRYSVSPEYRELQLDLRNRASNLLNTIEEHNWLDKFEWYLDLFDLTPQTWFNDLEGCNYNGPFVVRGIINSRKHQWNSHMFASNRRDACKVASELSNDSTIGKQKLIFRRYIPLRTYDIGLNGVRYTNEWRFFFYKGFRLAHGYYWKNAPDPDRAVIGQDGVEFAQQIADYIGDKATFYAIDIAETEDGEWILIDLNDAQDAELPFDPLEKITNNFYWNLAKATHAKLLFPNS